MWSASQDLDTVHTSYAIIDPINQIKLLYCHGRIACLSYTTSYSANAIRKEKGKVLWAEQFKGRWKDARRRLVNRFSSFGGHRWHLGCFVTSFYLVPVHPYGSPTSVHAQQERLDTPRGSQTWEKNDDLKAKRMPIEYLHFVVELHTSTKSCPRRLYCTNIAFRLIRYLRQNATSYRKE